MGEGIRRRAIFGRVGCDEKKGGKMGVWRALLEVLLEAPFSKRIS